MTDYSHTFELTEVNDACGLLISENAELLIDFIYKNIHRAPYDDPTVRVGLVLKTLLRSGNDSVKVSAPSIEPATNDLTGLLTNSSSDIERKIYTDELKFLRSCTILDDLISLNTLAAPL
jgi:hypothetical protein